MYLKMKILKPSMLKIKKNTDDKTSCLPPGPRLEAVCWPWCPP